MLILLSKVLEQWLKSSKITPDYKKAVIWWFDWTLTSLPCRFGLDHNAGPFGTAAVIGTPRIFWATTSFREKVMRVDFTKTKPKVKGPPGRYAAAAKDCQPCRCVLCR